MKSFVLRGDLCYSTTPQVLETAEGGFLVCEEGICTGTYRTLPERYSSLPLLDYAGLLVIPGLTDLHVHAPQFPYRGAGMDLELLDWLERYTFPEESRYAVLDYAAASYRAFTEELRAGPNTRACVFATVHTEAALLLMDLLEDSGLMTMAGKVSMDRNCPDALREEAPLEAVRNWLDACGRYQRTKPILTPRFIPSCTDGLLMGLGQLARERGLPLQSHLSENLSEMAWVARLCPGSAGYADAYDGFGLFSGPTVMAHCVHSDGAETALLRERGVFAAHCPASNANLASGVAPVRRFLEEGLSVGLGSDVAGGTHTSILRAMADAIQASKLRWRLADQSLAPLTVPEAFYLGTMGGGAFFGQVGAFLPGYQCDAVVLDDRRISPPGRTWTVAERLERVVSLSDQVVVAHKFVSGTQLF